MAVSMLWYLFSPVRGTTRAPRLPANHPIRRAFYRHGKTTAQHWLVAMLFSVAIAMAFSYPTVFLAGNPTAGLTAYPPHFWTTSKPVDDNLTDADIEMRQVWVYGSHMGALDKAVLKQGLTIQQSLINDDDLSQVVPKSRGALNWNTWQWGFHSPLIYWNNSAQALEEDVDILTTINEQKHILSSLNIVLRPASVFAGKRFDGQYLQAADALVISLINKVNAEPQQPWQNDLRAQVMQTCANCTLFPRDGQPTRHRVYEFGFTPLSIREHIALTFAYSCMAIYVLLSLRRMKAFHSRFGLVVTAITQMTCSILASFTICNILKINLSMIPQNAYPFVVLVIGLENMFRLINAVVAYPPTMATELRIANALGDVGPLSVATAAQNLTILSLLSAVVSPGVAAFCAFAAIANLFDVFFLLTFFVAVLNVDIRRLELQDAIAARQGQPDHRRRPSPSQHPWFEALIQGRLPFSTRMAGTAVTTTFILSLNYHFFEHKVQNTSLQHLLKSIRGAAPSLKNLDSFGQPPVNITLTAEEWMRMQDIDTAREVLQLAKPGADTFVIRIFEPLTIVLSESDRTEALKAAEQWTQALRTFAIHHFYPVAVAVIFIVAFVAVLMNFLLYSEAGDDDNQIDLEEAEESLVVQSLETPHKLDVIKMASNESGHFVTVALDRTIAVAIADRAHQTYQMVPVPSKVLCSLAWPILHLAIDDAGEWLACHGADDSVTVYNCSSGDTISLLKYPDDNPPVIFDFMILQSSTRPKLHLVVLTSGGRLAMTAIDEPKSDHVELTSIPLVGATVVSTSGTSRRLIAITETADIVAFTWVDGAWNELNTAKLPLKAPLDRLTGPASIDICPEYETELLRVTTPTAAMFLESSTLVPESSFDLGEMARPGLAVDAFLVSQLRKCPACSGIGWRKAAIARDMPGKDRYCLTTWSAEGSEDTCICLAQSSAQCRSFDSLTKATHDITAPGAWCAVRSQVVLGLRKQPSLPGGKEGSNDRGLAPSLRQRRRTRHVAQAASLADRWEAYKLTVDGEMIVVDIAVNTDTAMGHQGKELYVDKAGPVVPLDGQAVAVAFGNTVKIIRASRRMSVSLHAGASQLERQPSVSTRRETTPKRGR